MKKAIPFNANHIRIRIRSLHQPILSENDRISCLNEPTGVYDWVRTHDWQTSTICESDGLSA